MASRYLRLKEIHRELLLRGRDKEAAEVLQAMQDLIRTGQVSSKELEAGFYI